MRRSREAVSSPSVVSQVMVSCWLEQGLQVSGVERARPSRSCRGLRGHRGGQWPARARAPAHRGGRPGRSCRWPAGTARCCRGGQRRCARGSSGPAAPRFRRDREQCCRAAMEKTLRYWAAIFSIFFSLPWPLSLRYLRRASMRRFMSMPASRGSGSRSSSTAEISVASGSCSVSLRGQQHVRQARVHGQRVHLAAVVGNAAVLERLQLVQHVGGLQHGCARGRVEPGKLLHVHNAPGCHVQHERGQVGLQNFGGAVGLQALVRGFGPEAVAGAGA